MDIFLEHAVGVLSCFVLLFQFCTVYVKGKGIYYFSLYAQRIIKYVASPPCNLINRKKTANSFQIVIRKVHFVIFFCNPVLILLKRNERYYV